MSNYLCITIFSIRTNVAIVNEKGDILYFKYVYYEEIPKKKDLIATLVKMSKEATQNFTADSGTISFPGVVDQVRGYCTFANGDEIEFRSEIQKKLNIPIFIDNDSNLCAIAEKQFGSMKYVENFIFVQVAWGVGAAIYLNNNIYTGNTNAAGEIGHIIVDESGGLVCECGNTGCLETIASSSAISKYYGVLKEDNDPPHYKDVAVLARKGDVFAIDAFTRAGYSVGKVISYLINTLNISHIVIGGTVGMEFDLLYPSIMEAINTFTFRTSSSNYNIAVTQTELGYDAAILGCAAACIFHEKNIEKFEKTFYNPK